MPLDHLHHDNLAVFESRLVQRALRRLGLADRQRVVAHEVEATGAMWPGQLTFAAVNAVYAELPVQLACFFGPPGGNAKDRDVAQLVTSAGDSEIVREFEACRERMTAEANGRALGLVFRYRGCRGGYVLYDLDPAGDQALAVIRLAGRRLYVARLHVVLDYLRANMGKAPEIEADGEAAVVPEPFDARAPVLPAIRELVGRHGPGLVLNLLVRMLTCRLTGSQTAWIVHRDGAAWIRMTGAEMAKLLEAGERTIKAAVADLKARELLAVKRGVRGNLYRLDPILVARLVNVAPDNTGQEIGSR